MTLKVREPTHISTNKIGAYGVYGGNSRGNYGRVNLGHVSPFLIDRFICQPEEIFNSMRMKPVEPEESTAGIFDPIEPEMSFDPPSVDSSLTAIPFKTSIIETLTSLDKNRFTKRKKSVMRDEDEGDEENVDEDEIAPYKSFSNTKRKRVEGHGDYSD